MKKTLLALLVTAVAGTAGAAQVLEAIVVRVGDRIVTRTQYLQRLAEGFNEIEQTTPPADALNKTRSESGTSTSAPQEVHASSRGL